MNEAFHSPLGPRILPDFIDTSAIVSKKIVSYLKNYTVPTWITREPIKLNVSSWGEYDEIVLKNF